MGATDDVMWSEDTRPEGAIGDVALDPRLTVRFPDGSAWTAAALEGLATKAYPRMASMLRRLESHFRSNYHCCYRGKKHLGGHDTDCILEETATLLRELP